MSSPRFPRWAIVLLGLFALAALLLVGSCAYLSRDEPPPDVSDLQLVYRDDIPDDQNAYALLTALAVKVPNPFTELDDEANERLEAIQRGEAWDAELVAHLLEDTEHLWPALEQALAAPDSQAPQLNSFADVIPEVGQLRQLSELACLRARQLAYHGSPDKAVRLLVATVTLGQRMQHSQSSLITWLTGAFIKTMASECLTQVATNTHLDDTTTTFAISALEHLRPSAGALTDTFKAEFHVSSTELANFAKKPAEEMAKLADNAEHPLPVRLTGWLPLAFKENKTRRIYADHLREVISLVDTDNQQLRDTHLGENIRIKIKPSANPNNAIGRVFLGIVIPTFGKIISVRHHEQSRLSATQAFLAVRAYQQNHDGELPPTLDALVPDYLSAVPLDYYDRAPIRYSREFRAIWSLGRDGEHTVTSADQPVEKGEVDLRLP